MPIALYGSTCSPYQNDGPQVVQFQGRTSYCTAHRVLVPPVWIFPMIHYFLGALRVFAMKLSREHRSIRTIAVIPVHAE